MSWFVGVEEQLTLAKKHAQEYKSQAEGFETNLKLLSASNKQYKDKSEAQIKQLQSSLDSLTTKCNSLEKEKQKLYTENTQLNQDSHHSNTDMRRQLTTLQVGIN